MSAMKDLIPLQSLYYSALVNIAGQYPLQLDQPGLTIHPLHPRLYGGDNWSVGTGAIPLSESISSTGATLEVSNCLCKTRAWLVLVIWLV